MAKGREYIIPSRPLSSALLRVTPTGDCHPHVTAGNVPVDGGDGHGNMGTSSTANHGEKHMAWVNGKRTVYCRHCYGKGHNRRGCPQLSETTKARYKSGDLQRKCSWCRQSGHTKTKCEIRQTEMNVYITDNAKYRGEVLALMEAQGIGYGALVTPKYNNKDRELDKDNLSIITRIDWDSIQLKDKDHRAVKAYNTMRDWENEYCVPALKDAYWAYGQLTVINKAKTSIREDMPVDWLSGKSGVDKYF